MNKKIIIGVSVIVLIMLFIILVNVGTKNNNIRYGSNSFNLFGDTVYIPMYHVSSCISRADNDAKIQITSHTDNPIIYKCTSDGTGKWIPEVNGIQCKYITEGKSYGQILDTVAIKCPLVEDVRLSDGKINPKCTVLQGFILTSEEREFTINAGEKIYIDTNKLIGDAKLWVEYPSYGLRTVSADGYTSPTGTNCYVNSLSSVFHTIDAKNRVEVLPDVPLNSVTGLQPAYTKSVISILEINNGQQIYITRPGYYNLVKTAEDGFKYVDSTAEFSSPRIQCVPGTLSCSDDAKVIRIAEQTCDIYGGSVTGYAPLEGDASQLCKYSCTDGKLKLTGDCIKVPTSCPAEAPLWDTNTGKCVKTISRGRDIEKSGDYLLLLWIIIGGVILLIVLFIIFSMTKNKVKGF